MKPTCTPPVKSTKSKVCPQCDGRGYYECPISWGFDMKRCNRCNDPAHMEFTKSI